MSGMSSREGSWNCGRSGTIVLEVTRLFWTFRHHTNEVGKVALLLMILLSAPLQGGRLYSYVDESGTTVLTNVGGERANTAAGQLKPQAVEAGNFATLIQQYGIQYGVDTDLIRAIISVESGFDPRAVSAKDCKGLMQLHPDTARRFGVSNVFDPAENIEGGVKYLTFLMDSFDRKLDLVLAAYNAGENAVRRYQGIPPFPETVQYVSKVKTAFGKELDPPTQKRRAQRVVRMIDENGAIILTNAPVRSVTAEQRISSSR